MVEIVPHPGTDPAVVARVCGLYRDLGKRPVVLQREIAGFIANRLQQALLREAAALVEAGVASTADVDAVVSGSFGRRLAVAGPFEVSDLAGLDVIAAIAGELWPDLAAGGVADLLAAPAAAGDYGAKTGRGFTDWSPARAPPPNSASPPPWPPSPPSRHRTVTPPSCWISGRIESGPISSLAVYSRSSARSAGWKPSTLRVCSVSSHR